MSANAWLSSYLDAYVGVAYNVEDRKETIVNADGNASARYFVNEILAYGEDDLRHTWSKLTASSNEEIRDSRLEYLCWRIWFMKRTKQKSEREVAQNSEALSALKEQASQEMEEDEEDMAAAVEIATPPTSGQSGGSSRLGSLKTAKSVRILPEQDVPEDGRYIVMISLHGLVRGEEMELGKDADTGGQVKYVVEMAKALAKDPKVRRVDLLTRLIADPAVDPTYSQPIEVLVPGATEHEGAFIVRCAAGPIDKYIRKEALWPYLPEFADNALMHILSVGNVLRIGNGQPLRPYVIHGHYADAGEAASILAGFFGVPMVATGHSLGRNKLQQLMKGGRMSKGAADKTYSISRRIEAEEIILDCAELVFVSTHEEIVNQWSIYDGYDEKLADYLAGKQLWRTTHMPWMLVIPPGMDFSTVTPPELDPETGNPVNPALDEEPSIWQEIGRFLRNPRKPAILALCRPDPKKNITSLIRAYANSRGLREIANLVLILGNRENIDAMAKGAAVELTTILKLIDAYDLYGQVAYPKHHQQTDVPEIYRFAALTKGIFVNPALQEPFGLTLIEAAAHGLPIVATQNGGPVDIIKTLENGLLIDPHDDQSIGDAILKLMTERAAWEECRSNGLTNIRLYSWDAHCKSYLKAIDACRQRFEGPKGWGFSSAIDVLMSATPGGSLEWMELQVKRMMGGAHKRSLTSLPDDTSVFLGTQRSLAADGYASFLGVADSESRIALAAALALRDATHIVVVAIDSVKGAGAEDELVPLVRALKAVIEAARQSGNTSTLFGIATACSFVEVRSALLVGGVDSQDVAFIIGNSGAEILYRDELGRGSTGIDAPSGAGNGEADGILISTASQFVRSASVGQGSFAFVLDTEYAGHVNFRWNREVIARAIARFRSQAEKAGLASFITDVVEHSEGADSNTLCYRLGQADASAINAFATDLQQWLRRRGCRCRLLYTRNCTELHVLPLRASRAQAIRYVATEAGLKDLNQVCIVTGYGGDADQVELLAGVPRIVIVSDGEKVSPSGPAKARMTFALETGAFAADGSAGPEGIVQGLKKFGFL